MGGDMGGAGTPPQRPGQGTDAPALPSFADSTRVWLKIGLLSFGGPAGQIALLHQEVVQRRGWIGERRFLHALSFCALLPGPEAQQLATYLGWLMHGPRGGVVAGTLFLLPGAAVLMALSILYATLGQVPAVQGLFFGLKCAVLAIIVEALIRIARRALRTGLAWLAASCAFLALDLFGVPFPAVVLAAGLAGALLPRATAPRRQDTGAAERPGLIDQAMEADPGGAAPRRRAARRAGMAALLLWAAPLAALTWRAPGRFADIAWFFSRMAVVTIGGAYAGLAYIAQDAVHAHHWLSAKDMLAGLGLAETTPGPLILVAQFAGFLAGYHAPGSVSGLWGGIAGSVLTLWMTFVPCFAFVFLGAPLIERLAANARLAGSLALITASVVGVIANLALWFGLRVLFAGTLSWRFGPALVEVPRLATLDAAAALVAGCAAILVFGFRQSALRALLVCAILGVFIEVASKTR
jgi:chromate transporter